MKMTNNLVKFRSERVKTERAKLNNLNRHPLLVSPYRDPQLKVGKNYHVCLICDETFPNLNV